MDATRADFRTKFAEFASASDGDVDEVLEEAIVIHNRNPLATLYCAAHLLVLNQRAAAEGTDAIPTGEVSFEQAGPLAANYVTQAESPGRGRGSRQSFFTSTSYGKRFLILEQRTSRSAIGAVVVGGRSARAT